MEDAMRKTIESYVVDSKRLELKEKIGSGDYKSWSLTDLKYSQ